MAEKILILFLMWGFQLYHDNNKATEYELTMDDGTTTQVVLQKSNKYACPLYCSVDHIHHAVVYEDSNVSKASQSKYHISGKNDNGIPIFCSQKNILSMNKIEVKPGKKDSPSSVNASAEN